MFPVQREQVLGMSRQFLELTVVISIAKRVYIIVASLSFRASLMPSVQFRYILVTAYNSSLIFLFPFFTSRFILNEPLLGPIRPVCFCIPHFWFLLAGKLDVVDRLYLKRALVIARSVRWLCCWQMGTVNIESVLDLRILLQLTSGERCQHFCYYLSADLKKNCLDLYIFFEPITKSRLWIGSLPPLRLPPHYIFFWNRQNSQDVRAGWHEWVPTTLTDLLKDLFFAWELHIWPRMIILGSGLVEIIGRSHLKKSDWLACLFHFNLLSPSQSNYHYVVDYYACLKHLFNPFIGGIC